MLRETKCYMVYPNKSVIEDIVTRDGAPNEDSFSPFTGKRSVIDAQFCSSQRSRFKLGDFLQYTKNRDLNPTIVKVSKQYGMLEDSERVIAGFRTLEDMVTNGQESRAVEDYLIMLCVGFKKDKESPYRKAQNEPTRVIRNLGGDDDEATEEKYLLERDNENISNEEYEDTLRELPYLIKSIWSYSKQYQGNIFSFAFAYASIVESKNGKGDVNIQDFRNYTTYCINKDGSFKKVFVHGDDNKYTIYPALTKIFIAPGSHQAEFNLCMKFLNALKILGIDYRDEDPLQFNNDFMSRLICTYLPGNEQYIQEYKGVDPEILVALSPEHVFATAKASVYIPVDSVSDSYDYTQTIYFISESLNLAYKLWSTNKRSTLFDEKEDVAISILEKYLKVYTKNPATSVPTDLLFFHPATGILYMKNKDNKNRSRIQNYLTLDGKYFGTFKSRSDYKVILTKYGFIIALEEEYDKVYYLSPEDCLEALEDYNEYEFEQRKENWRALGVYSE